MAEARTTTRRKFLSFNGTAAIAGCAGVNLGVCSDAVAGSSHWHRMPHPPVHGSGPNGAVISGYCAPAFRSVFDAFVANFNRRGEIGASIGVTFKGMPVLEAWPPPELAIRRPSSIGQLYLGTPQSIAIEPVTHASTR